MSEEQVVEKEEVKKENPLLAIQAEYNQAVGLLGHNITQQENLQIEEKQLKERLRRLVNKAANIKQPKEEIKNGEASN